MKCFLTSSPFLPDRSSINPANGFADRIRASVSSPCKALFICSDPDSHEQTGRFCAGGQSEPGSAGSAV